MKIEAASSKLPLFVTINLFKVSFNCYAWQRSAISSESKHFICQFVYKTLFHCDFSSHLCHNCQQHKTIHEPYWGFSTLPVLMNLSISFINWSKKFFIYIEFLFFSISSLNGNSNKQDSHLTVLICGLSMFDYWLKKLYQRIYY